MKERFEVFTVLINRISRNIRRIKNREMTEYNLRSVHVSCLYYIYKAENVTATELFEKCEEDKATISRALFYLEKNKFITCESKSTKRYKSPLVLTDKGREVAEKISAKIDGVLHKIGALLSKKERDDFYRTLSVISEQLDAFSQTDEAAALATIREMQEKDVFAHVIKLGDMMCEGLDALIRKPALKTSFQSAASPPIAAYPLKASALCPILMSSRSIPKSCWKKTFSVWRSTTFASPIPRKISKSI